MSAEAKLKELGIALPEPPAAVAAYAPWVIVGNQVITSGQLPWRDGKIAYAGKLGGELSEQQGYEAARLCAVNALAQLRAAAGSLDRIERIIRLEGNVHSAAGFRGHPQVLNGASDLFNAVFGERGRHTRTALGINEMPLDAAVQLSVYAQIKSQEPAGPFPARMRFAHFTLATRDVAASSKFFQQTLQWQPIDRPSNIGRPAAWLNIADGQELHLIEVPDFEPSPFEREFGRHLAIEYPQDQFAVLRERLVRHGAELIPPERDTPFERFFFRDPNGYVFEIVPAGHPPESS